MNARISREMKSLTLFLLILVALFVGILLIWTFIKADFKGVVTNLDQEHFTLEVEGDDPEAEYPAYVIYFDENTVINGIGSDVNDLMEGQEVKVWTEKVNERIVAKKIEIVDEGKSSEGKKAIG